VWDEEKHAPAEIKDVILLGLTEAAARQHCRRLNIALVGLPAAIGTMEAGREGLKPTRIIPS
jgi:hypothetical protein